LVQLSDCLHLHSGSDLHPVFPHLCCQGLRRHHSQHRALRLLLRRPADDSPDWCPDSTPRLLVGQENVQRQNRPGSVADADLLTVARRSLPLRDYGRADGVLDHPIPCLLLLGDGEGRTEVHHSRRAFRRAGSFHQVPRFRGGPALVAGSGPHCPVGKMGPPWSAARREPGDLHRWLPPGHTLRLAGVEHLRQQPGICPDTLDRC